MQFLVFSVVILAAFVLLIILVARISGQSTRIGLLEREIKKLRELEKHVNELSTSIGAIKNQVEDLKPSLRRRETVEAVFPPARVPDAGTAAVSPQISPLKTQVPTPTASRTREEWEALIGGKLLNRIGAVALIIGIGFFLKYAFDNNWINETARVLIGAAMGGLCLAGGYRTDRRGFQIFAQGLVGAGIAILYLAVYAAFNFYHLLPQWVAFLLMSIVTIAAFFNGLYFNSLAEGVLGWAGGFLTPIMLSTGQANEIGLFTYIVLLDAGLIAMVIKHDRWAILEPLAFIGTWLMFVTWSEQNYTDGDFWLTVFFVTLFWALFLVPDILRSRASGNVDRFTSVVPVLSAVFYFLALYILIDKDHHGWMGLITLMVGAIYFAIFFVQQRRGNLRNEVKIQYALTAAALLTIATAIQFKDFDTVIFWSIEAAALAWCAQEWQEGFVRTASLVLFGLAMFKLLFVTGNGLMYSPIRDFTLLLNHRALAFAVVGGCLGVATLTVDRSASTRRKQMSNVLHALWCLTLFLLATAETNDFFRFKMLDQPGEIRSRLAFFRDMTYTVVWMMLSLPLIWTALRRQLLPLLIAGLCLSFLAAVFASVRGIAFEPIASYTPLLNIRSISILLVATGLLLQAQFLQKSPHAFNNLKNALAAAQIGMVVVIFVLLTGETRDFFQRNIAALAGQADYSSAAMSRLTNLQQMSISGIWLLYSAVLIVVGIWRKYRGMRLVAIVLFGITILKIFIYDLSFLETLYRFISFGALGAILIAVSYAYQKYKDVIGGDI